MPIADLIDDVDQCQFGEFLAGHGTAHYELVSLKRQPAVRAYKLTDIPGGGSDTPRVEAAEMALTLDFEVWGTTAADLDAAWVLFEAAYSVAVGSPVTDQVFAWRLNGQTDISYVMAHVEQPPTMVHDYIADVGFMRGTTVGLVASDPTIHTV